MKVKKIIIACLASIVFFGLAGLAGADVVDVYPEGNPATDVAAVQGAIFAAGEGGTVILHATMEGETTPTAFDFGTNGQCWVPHSLTIMGDAKGDPMTGKGMTKIVNGEVPFLIYASSADVEIRNIHFHNHSVAAIVAHQCQNFTAMENRITADTMEGKTFPPTNEGFGIIVEGLDLVTGVIIPEYVHGDVVIQDNYVNLEQNPVSPPAWLTYSVFVGYTVGDIRIRGNHTYNDVGDSLACINNQGDILIERNFVELTPDVQDGIIPFGVNVAFFNILIPDGFGENSVQNIQVSKNEVVCPATATYLYDSQWGISVWADYDVNQEGTISIHQNKITLYNGGIGIYYGGMDNAYIGQNQIMGVGFHAIVLGSDFIIPTNHNVLLGNNMSALEASISDIAFIYLADNNVIVGGSGTLLDFGAGNVFKGGYWDAVTGEHVIDLGGVGDKISGALRNFHGISVLP